ncbi:polar localization protein TipN [Phenylobacterium terrae]|uniref:Polar localization protein TipN n=1 Tax=Phenylobacterium terrae TaxID=2665495 RepID=A0ABW4N7P7_9CAUL
MKIKKRRQPADFQSLSDETVDVPAELADPEPDVELGYVFRKRQTGFHPAAGGALSPVEASPPATAEENDFTPISPAPVARTGADAVRPPPGWPVWTAAFAVSILALFPIAYAWGLRDGGAALATDVFAKTVFFVIALLPALFVWAGAWLYRQGQLLATETRRTQALAHQMVAPAALAAGEVGEVTSGLREDISAAAEAARSAHQSLSSLRQALAEETQRLAEAAATSSRTARELAQALHQERTQMSGLSETLGGQAAKVADAITQQARMVAEASDLAETQLREAEASLASRAADLTAAAGQASDAAKVAGEDLARHVARLETAGMGVADQVRAAEQGLSEQRAALMTVAHALRADHSAFAAEAESQAAQLSNFIADAREVAAGMGQRALEQGEALRRLIAEASERFAELTRTASTERDAFAQDAGRSISVVSEAARAERERLETQARAAVEALAKAVQETQAAAARQAQTAREQVDQLAEAAFAAGQKANQVFEARLGEARALIEGSAQLVEQAGADTARKLESGAVAAREALTELTQMLADIERRTAELPASARRQAQDVRDAVADSIEALIGQARRTAEETQAIDTAFQERVRRNYEVLSQAVQLMGAVTGAAAPAPAPAPAPAAAAPEPKPQAPEPGHAAKAARPAPEKAEAGPALEPTAARLGLRPRLRLTPTATDEEFTQVFESATGGARLEEPPAPMAGADGWTWKELLSSIDEGEGADEQAEDAEAVVLAEVARMGVDATALLPQPRTDELAAVIQAGDASGAREVVKGLAPAAIRRLSRRLNGDKKLKSAAAGFVSSYRAVLTEAAQRDSRGYMVANLLDTDAGRAFLLVDAAAGDLA